MKNLAASRNSGAYGSPGSPGHGDNEGENGEGWSSERVSLPTNSLCRHISAPAFMPLGIGRALPSKWDDAERWITSPVSGSDFYGTPIMQPKRQLESSSGPLVGHGLLKPDHSPTLPVLKGKAARNLMASSPLMSGVLVPSDLSVLYGSCTASKPNHLYTGNHIARSISMPGFSDTLTDCSLSSSQGDTFDGTKEGEATVSRVVSRRDMATQMSPVGSTCSSSKGNLSNSLFPSTVSTSLESLGNHSAKDGVRDVQVDEATTLSGQPKKGKVKKGSRNIKNSLPLQDVSEASRLQREEAKITAWENLQRAKAEAAIRKLEMELERKRATSTERILKKLKAAQIKAQAMRDSLSENQSQQSSQRSSHSVVIFWKCLKTASLCNCIFCHWKLCFI